MKKQETVLKRAWVLLLTISYLFIAAGYILFLPKYYQLRSSTNYAHQNGPTVLNSKQRSTHSYGTILVLVHQVYRSSIETKRFELNSGLSRIAFIITLFFTGGLALIKLLQRQYDYVNSYEHAKRDACLSYCTLRI